jgi:3-dehydroquinate dehydratase-2
MEQVIVDIQRMHPEVYIEYRQSNHEGILIDWMQELGLLATSSEPFDGIILNAGGYTHTSVALRDAIACSQVPVIEVHISDITQREAFRHVSLLTDVCQHSIIGHGIEGYQEAVDWIIKHTK